MKGHGKGSVQFASIKLFVSLKSQLNHRGAFCERMNFPSFLFFLPVTKEALLLIFSATVGFFFHNIPPTSFHTSQEASDHHYTTAASSHGVSLILHCLPGCEGILTSPTASECSRTGRATGRTCFQLFVLKWLTDVQWISCLGTSTSSVPSYSKHKQWIGRSEICSEPGCQNRNIFLKGKCQKKKKKEGRREVFMQFIGRCT